MFGLTLIASLYYYAINCCHALLKRPKRASSLPEQPQRPEELVALMLGVTAQMALQLCCQPIWQCLCPQDSVLSSHGVFFSAGFQSFKNHIENIRQGEEDWFSLLSYLSYLSQERELEKTASTILVAFFMAAFNAYLKRRQCLVENTHLFQTTNGSFAFFPQV